MRRIGRLSGLGVLLLLGCGGGQPAPPASPPPGSALAKDPVEKADLSPVAAPPELFLVGRLKRPGPIADTLGKWAGLPGNLRTLLGQELHGLDSALVWDAPVEVAVALPSGGRRRAIHAVVSFGLSSVGAMVNVARERGLAPERIQPEVFAITGPNGVSCVVGPSLGSASARLVCGDSAAEVEGLFAYVTRGLPNENLGNRDLEVELRAEPLRKRFSSEIAGTRLFAGFLLRQLETDHPRLDRAISDAAYGVADELVLEVEDTDSIEFGGSLDEAKQNVSLEIAWKFRSSRSWLGSYAAELSRRPGPVPDAFARLPGDASGAGYTVDLGTERIAPVRTSLVELVDAYLESERLGKNTREHARQLFTGLFRFTAPSVHSKGNFAPGSSASEAEKKLGWRVVRVELPASEIERIFQDFHALAGDRELWKVVAKRFDLDPKVSLKSELVPLTGKGVPAGARALIVTIPPGLTERVQKSTGSRIKLESKEPVKIVVAVASDGQNASVVVASSDKKDATARLQAFLGSGGRRLAERSELAPLRSLQALHGEFFTLLGLLDSAPEPSGGSPAARLPSRGEVPIFASYTASPGPPLVLSASVTVPAAAIADLPGAAKSLRHVF